MRFAAVAALALVVGCSSEPRSEDAPASESAAHEETTREKAARDETTRDETARDEAPREGVARDAAPREGAARDAATRAGAAHEEAVSKVSRTANRLIHEKSPYLLQHAYNPVAWYPWGDEAFDKAQREDKPIFLSVGYSTCHWCHVMERESFEDTSIARVLNESFVPIKVDREERPDVDDVYMKFVQAATGGGGWPMSVWLTPAREPFYGGTYFPPHRVGNRPGFLEVLTFIRDRWQSDRAEIVASAGRFVAELRDRAQLASAAEEALEPREAFIDSAYVLQKSRFDARLGGFGSAPKFPRPYELLFLHRVYRRTGDAEALEMSRRTLTAMADGGIHDQLGGGFHRYSTDPQWLLPHFEKMLYDQAQLVMAYVEAYQLTEDARFAEITRDILDYVRRDLTGEHGGFFSAEDADSAVDLDTPHDKEEGAFYVWTLDEIQAHLEPPVAELVVRHYGVHERGNTNSRELFGRNVLHVAEPLTESAAALGIEPEEAHRRLQSAHEKLLAARAARPRPHLDDKVLTAWNGLMISAFARAASVLRAPEYLASATRAAEFIHTTLWDPDEKRLLRRFRDGEAAIRAYNVDYAYMVQGLLDLYEASFEQRWLDWARLLTDRQIDLFGDPAAGAFYETTGEDPSVLVRGKDDYDGAQPTSNSVAALNLLRLGEMTDSARYRASAQQILRLYAPRLQQFGPALPAMMLALDFRISTPRQIIIAGSPGAPDTSELLDAVHARFLPHKVLLLADGGAAQARMAEELPILASVVQESGQATAYVCQNYACQLPVTSAADLTKLLEDGG